MAEEKKTGGYRPTENFDERLALLRFVRVLPILLVITIIGSLVFGGLHVLRKTYLAGPDRYRANTYYWITYTLEYEEEGDYYINDYTWNTYIHSDVFTEQVLAGIEQAGYSDDLITEASRLKLTAADSRAALIAMTTADVESDIHVPNILVTTTSPEVSLAIAKEISKVMTDSFAGENDQLTNIRILTDTVVSEVDRDVRAVRAFILAALLSFFFATALYLLWECGTDSIYVPAQLSRKQIPCVGTLAGKEFAQNIKYLFRGMGTIALVPVGEDLDPQEIASKIAATEGLTKFEDAFYPVPSPLLVPECVGNLQGADGILLAVRAGSRSGKQLDHLLEYLHTQEIRPTAVLLCEEDEWLNRLYYRIGEETDACSVDL